MTVSLTEIPTHVGNNNIIDCSNPYPCLNPLYVKEIQKLHHIMQLVMFVLPQPISVSHYHDLYCCLLKMASAVQEMNIKMITFDK